MINTWRSCRYLIACFLLIWLSSISLLVQASTAVKATIPWKGETFFLRTKGISVANLLRDLGANYHVPVIVSNMVNDVFVGEISGTTPEQTLARLGRLFNIVWYHDGEVLYVYKAREVTSAVVTPQYLPPAELSRYLVRSKIINGAGCRLSNVAGFQAFEVLGVPACVQRVSRLAKEIDGKAKMDAANKESVRVFPLRYASAADVSYQYRQQTVVVPGVVTILNQMKSGNTLPVGSSKEQQGTGGSETQFSADPNQNALIIRSREINMPLYEKLISQMDKRQRQIEISVAIIDVDEGDLRQLGVDWSGQIGGGSAKMTFNTDVGASNYFSSVISNSNDFMVRISALQQHSKARILSQPSVVTLNNVQAILDKNITFYTKLEGENVAKLESVTSGTLMRVTPRLVEDSMGLGMVQEIMLLLNIQDGQQNGVTSANEPLPQVQNSEITTQATLKPGQSLLLGGFVQDKEVNAKRSIPLLGDIPFVGKLFSTTRHEVHSVVRLFLIKAEPVKATTGQK